MKTAIKGETNKDFGKADEYNSAGFTPAAQAIARKIRLNFAVASPNGLEADDAGAS
jgi:hypothetical protein